MSNLTPQQPAAEWHPGSASPPPVGTVVAGKYVIEGLLGRGGMGAVYRAQHQFTQRRVALKWLLADDEAMRMRFIREARAMGALEHPNVVGILDIGEDQGAVYLVMEFIEGETLRAHLNRQPVSPARAVALLMPALEGIAAAHQAGIVHRDLKPANLFVCLDRDGTAYGTKVLDFGVALSMRPSGSGLGLTQSGAVVGTPRYMAPEQIRGDRRVDARADQFAMGLILYEALTGRLPYDAAVYEALVVEIATVAPPNPQLFVSGLPDALASVVLKALAKNPDDRFADIASFARALEPFGDGVVFSPPRQAHARRSMLGDDVAELAQASAALTPSRPSAAAALDERLTGPPTRDIGGPGNGGAVRASATTLEEVQQQVSDATRRVGPGPRVDKDAALPPSPTNGQASALAEDSGASAQLTGWHSMPRRAAVLGLAAGAIALSLGAWLLLRPAPSAGGPASAPGGPTAPATSAATLTGAMDPTAPAEEPGGAAAQESPHDAQQAPSELGSDAGAADARTEQHQPVGGQDTDPGPQAVPTADAPSRAPTTARHHGSPHGAPAATPSATAMRAVGRSGHFAVEDF